MIEDRASLQASNKEFSLFHMNIRSLPLHYDGFYTLLFDLNVDFQVIDLSETKRCKDAPITFNIDIPGYNFHYYSSISAAAGVGIYVKSNLNANEWDDLIFCKSAFEINWVGIDNPKAKNILCCCAYPHSSTDITKYKKPFLLAT